MLKLDNVWLFYSYFPKIDFLVIIFGYIIKNVILQTALFHIMVIKTQTASLDFKELNTLSMHVS